MSRTSDLLVLSLLVLLCLGPLANTASSQDKHAEFIRTIEMIQDILAGKNGEQAKAIIARGARLIMGAKLENLRGVVAGEIKTCSLADTSYHCVEISGRTNLLEDMGFIELKTRTNENRVRYHTVVFENDSTGKYKIVSWHSGE